MSLSQQDWLQYHGDAQSGEVKKEQRGQDQCWAGKDWVEQLVLWDLQQEEVRLQCQGIEAEKWNPQIQ